MKKHIGTMLGTGSRVYVIYRQLPDQPNTCLVVYRDSIPEIYSYAVGKFVEHEGQETTTEDLADMMHRRGIMPTGENMLMALHNKGLLTPKKTEDVVMWLDEQNSIPLNVLNDNLGMLDMKKPETQVSDFNPFDSVETTVIDDIIHKIKDMERGIEQLVNRAKMLDDTFEYGAPTTAEPATEEHTDDLVIRISAEDVRTMSLTKFNELTKGVFREHKKLLNS